MQVGFNIARFKKIEHEGPIAREALVGDRGVKSNSFVFFGEYHFSAPDSGFEVKAFFLESTITVELNSVFIFSLEKRESAETYISCFYNQEHPSLSVWFNEQKIIKGFCFSVNRFEHDALVSSYPLHLDKISAALCCRDDTVLGYKIFDASLTNDVLAKKMLYFKYFLPRKGFGLRFVRRNRFYKRRFNRFSRFC